ncbi:hypothetical protein KP509_17G084200 [Ceratopteris richardii]|uniref:Pentatricopeptide repeat-containing protein n=1 Tax=Ceratopteris richardii TaxID=49495 RepID=A0A8T2SXI9_CERRI|nr:hypothetical protein KP509_17G084200 [Ceratopteris richardii]
MHEEIVSKGLLETFALGNALVDMYANCGFLQRALEVFDILPKRDVISWNALMSGYVKYEYGIRALNCLAQMQIEGVNPDFSTLVCGLKSAEEQIRGGWTSIFWHRSCVLRDWEAKLGFWSRRISFPKGGRSGLTREKVACLWLCSTVQVSSYMIGSEGRTQFY